MAPWALGHALAPFYTIGLVALITFVVYWVDKHMMFTHLVFYFVCVCRVSCNVCLVFRYISFLHGLPWFPLLLLGPPDPLGPPGPLGPVIFKCSLGDSGVEGGWEDPSDAEPP